MSMATVLAYLKSLHVMFGFCLVFLFCVLSIFNLIFVVITKLQRRYSLSLLNRKLLVKEWQRIQNSDGYHLQIILKVRYRDT